MSDSIAELKRTHYCGELTIQDCGKEVVVFGWTQRQRDLGGLIFIDLRDRTGIIQLAFDQQTEKEIFDKAFAVRSEYVLAAKGIIRERTAKNFDIPTGEIEIEVEDLRLLSKSETPPFEILDEIKANEALRLKYRYLDLRRSSLQNNLICRHKIAKIARNYFDENGFLEIETPMLIKSTPEGARDYLVPSRIKNGSFYALPQSPQLYKQLLMLSGFDRYMQIARCFRDEDLRADRQPEFTQIDLEMSFVNENDIMEINEGFLKRLFKELLDIELETPFPRMTYSEAMERFGSDKPDTRFEMELCDLKDELASCEFRVFSGALQSGGAVMGINAKGAAGKLSRKEIDKLTAWVKDYGAKGLAWTRITGESAPSSYEKFLSEEEVKSVRRKLDAKDSDVILIVADSDPQTAYDSLGALRCELAKRLNLIDNDAFNFLWVTDFPLFEYNKDEDRYVAKHHPFTAPKNDDFEMIAKEPAKATARAYDIVLNGTELGGGSIRINNPEAQEKMLRALGFTDEQARSQFGFLLDAFKYGAPPHGGMAYGLDRLTMLIAGADNIRDVMAFPKVQNASELMSDCPSSVDKKQLDELGISINETK